jgi:hypothetical protein
LKRPVKTCQICNSTKAVYAFYNSKESVDGLDPICKLCRRKRRAERATEVFIERRLGYIKAPASKQCRKCGQEKKIEDFGVLESRPDGRNSQCRECRCKIQNYYRERNKQRAAADRREIEAKIFGNVNK